MNKLVSRLLIARKAHWAAIMSVLPLFGYPQQTPLKDNTSHKNAQALEPRKRLVTWSYLRAMTVNNQNPTIIQFLKEHNQLVSKEMDWAVFTGKCNPYDNSCGEKEYDDGAKTAAWRVDLPVYLDDQPVFVSFVVIYAKGSHEPIAQGVQVYGIKASTSSNYAQPAASYDKSTGELNLIGDLTNRALAVVGNRQLKAESSGFGSLKGNAIHASLTPKSSPSSTIYESTVIYLNVKVKVANAIGEGVLQFNGAKGPAFHYSITPI
jgi:hypothetical protein